MASLLAAAAAALPGGATHSVSWLVLRPAGAAAGLCWVLPGCPDEDCWHSSSSLLWEEGRMDRQNSNNNNHISSSC